MFLKVFLILFDSNKVAVSSAKILSIWFLYSRRDPGNIQHSLSLSCFGVRRAVGHTESFLDFLFDTEIEYGQHQFALPLEKAPSWQTMSSIEVVISSSFEATSVESPVVREKTLYNSLRNIDQEGICLRFSHSLEITNISRISFEIFGSEWIFDLRKPE